MESSSHSRLRHRMALLAALPFALAGFMLAPAAAADQGSSPVTSVDAAEQADGSGPGSSSPTESTETDASGSSEESSSTEDQTPIGESSPSGQSSPDPSTTEPAAPEAGEQASEESRDQGSPQAAEPAATVPKAAPSQAAGGAQRAKPPQHKFTICHRTNSSTNPYNEITVDRDSLIRQGHLNHTGPIFTPTLKIKWGDIIPPVPPELPLGMNWPAGAPILNNGCEVPPPPDVGPQPGASIGEVACVGTVPSVDVTVTNGANATAPANFAILVDDVVVQNVGPVAPGGSQTVTLTGDADGLQEDATITVEVQSPPGGEVIDSAVITVNCAAPPPDVEVNAELVCVGDVAQGTVTVTNNGQQPVVVTATVNDTQVPPELTVGPGATETAMADLSQFEDQTITVAILVDGVVLSTYTVTPDCVAPIANPSVGVSGQVCPPPSATVTLGNTGDPDSAVVFVILVDGKVVQRSSPIFGGDTTTIVGDLSQFEDQTVVVELRANGKVMGSRTIHVNCTTVAGTSASTAQPASTGSGGLPGSSSSGSGVLPAVGAGFGGSVIALGLGLVLVGSLLIGAASRRRGPGQA
jgi:hypothetical protein